MSNHYTTAVAEGYRFECPCAELFNSISAAASCKKCRNYSLYAGLYVTDVSTGELVYGSFPTEEEKAGIWADYNAGLAREAEEEARFEAERAAAAAEKRDDAKLFYWIDRAEEMGY